MQIDRRGFFVALVLLVAFAALSCKSPQQNSNQQNVNQPQAAKPGHWIAQWRSSSSTGVQGTNLATFSYSSISVVSTSVVFVAGDMPNPKDQNERIGVFVYTTNGGQNWTEKLVEQPGMRIPTLNSIHFVDPNVGWAVGAAIAGKDDLEGIVLKTTDGGGTWAVSKVGFKQIPTSLFFVDANTGWMGGSTPPPGEDEGDGGPSDILATTDGGSTWQRQRRVPVSINDLFFIDKNTGWAAGYRGTIYHTTDGGRSWVQQRSELELDERATDPNSEAAKRFVMSGIHFTDGRNGFACAYDEDREVGRILGTVNGGEAWARKLIAQGEGIRDVFFISPTEGWAAPYDGNYIYHTTDGGRFWLSENIIFEQEVPFFKIGAADASHVWAVGGGAIFYRAAD